MLKQKYCFLLNIFAVIFLACTCAKAKTIPSFLVTGRSQFANSKRLQGAADARRRASRRTNVLQVSANAAGAVPCERLPFLLHADAVNNYITKEYVLSPDGSYTLNLSMQTKIKTYKGKKDRADFRYPYNSAFETVTVNSASTVKPSGSILKAGTKEIHDIIDPSTSSSSFYSKSRLRVINFPAVEKGSKIELNLTVKNKLGFWPVESFRLSDPTLKKKVIVKIPLKADGRPAEMLTAKLNDKKIKFEKKITKNFIVYSWTGKNLVAADTEPMSPGLINRDDCLIMSFCNSWKNVARFLKLKFKLNSFKSFSKGLIPLWAKEKTDDDIYRAMMKHISVYPVSLFKTNLSFQSASITLKKGYGRSFDLALLFKWLLKSRGISSDLVLADTKGDFIMPLEKTFSPALFDQVIVRSKGRFYNFSDRDIPPGTSLAEGSMGLDLDLEKLNFINSINSDSKNTAMVMNISEQGTLSGRCTKTFTGVFTIGARKELRYVKGRELEIKISEMIHAIDPAAKLRQWLQPSGLSESVHKVRLNFDFSLDTPFAQSSDRLFFPLPLPEILTPLNRFLPDRHSPIALPLEKTETLSFSMNFPSNLKPVFLPVDTMGKAGPLSWEIKTEFKKTRINYYRKISLARTMVPISLVPNFLTRVKELCSRNNRVIIFSRLHNGH